MVIDRLSQKRNLSRSGLCCEGRGSWENEPDDKGSLTGVTYWRRTQFDHMSYQTVFPFVTGLFVGWQTHTNPLHSHILIQCHDSH